MTISARPSQPALVHAALVFGVVLVAALVGIATRPLDGLASFWPANAILLGLWIRFPYRVSVYGFVAAFGGYLVADLLTGAALSNAVWLTLANLAGVATGLWVAGRAAPSQRRLQSPDSIVTYLRVCIAAACGAGIGGVLMAPYILDRSRLEGFGFWFSSEFANYIVVLPVMFYLPLPPAPWGKRGQLTVARVVPGLSLVVSLAIAAVVGGSGAIAIPVPFMIWCALAYGVGATIAVNFVVSTFFLIASAFAWMDIEPTANDTWAVLSVRIGVALLVLGPLTLALINRDRMLALKRLEMQARSDSLSGLFNRGAFDAESERLAGVARGNAISLAALMIDVDHFKQVNDAHGHHAGDQVLRGVAELIRETLPNDAILGRLGGEEYAALIPRVSVAEAEHYACDLIARIGARGFRTDGADDILVTASCGVAYARADQQVTVDRLMHLADEALYRAKAEGRNRSSIVTI